jgi:uncharacterized protein (UPF0261 family)
MKIIAVVSLIASMNVFAYVQDGDDLYFIKHSVHGFNDMDRHILENHCLKGTIKVIDDQMTTCKWKVSK